MTVNLSPEAIVPVFFRFFISIFSLAISFLLLIKSKVTKFLLVRMLPLFVVSPLTVILSNVLSSPVLVKTPLIFILLLLTIFPLFSSLDTEIFLFALNSFSFLISFEVKKPLVKIVPLFKTLFATVIFSTAWIFPIFVKFPFISNFLAVETFPEFSNLPILISLLTLITLSFLTSFDVKVPLVKISPVFMIFSFIFILSNVWISPLFIKLPSTFNFLFDITFPEFSNLETLISSFVINLFVVFKFLEVKELLVNISPLLSTLFITEIFPVVWIVPLLIKFPSIFNSLSVATIPELSKLATEIPSFAINFFVVTVSLDVNVLLVNISPVLFVFSTTDIFPTAWIFPEFIKPLLMFNSFSVATVPLFSNLLVVIPFFATNFLVEITSFAEKELLVSISPLLFTFPDTEILSRACTSPLFIKLPFISIFLSVAIIPEFSNLLTEIPSFATSFLVDTVSFAVRFLFVRISPLFVKFPSTSILFIACIIPVLVKSFVFNSSFVYIFALFSTVPFRLICLFACVPVPDNFILSAFIDIPSSEYAKSFCSYSFPLISIPLPCTLFTFIFPSAVISNLLFLDTIKASEFTPAPLSVLIIFILFAYIPPKFLASIAISPFIFFSVIFPFLSILLEPATTFKSLVTTFPLNSNVFAINST